MKMKVRKRRWWTSEAKAKACVRVSDRTGDASTNTLRRRKLNCRGGAMRWASAQERVRVRVQAPMKMQGGMGRYCIVLRCSVQFVVLADIVVILDCRQ